MFDEEEPRPSPKRLAPTLLEPLGLTELERYIEELRAEIVRVDIEIARKRNHRGAADALFRSG